jgi:hypothetical protein
MSMSHQKYLSGGAGVLLSTMIRPVMNTTKSRLITGEAYILGMLGTEQ